MSRSYKKTISFGKSDNGGSNRCKKTWGDYAVEKARKDVNKEIKIVDNMTHFFFLDDLVKDILPLIFEFVDKYCPLNKNLNKIEINFDKNIYLSKEELKQSIFDRTGKEEIEDN